LIVGEVRGAEALDLISALNTGHKGSLTTVHANTPGEAMLRLETLALSAGDVSESAVHRQLRAAVDRVIQVERSPTGRRIVEIASRDTLGWAS
jgi:pilus assembly protein CpaF